MKTVLKYLMALLAVTMFSTAANAALVPFYHYYNSSVNDHFYTTNWNEIGSGAYGWSYVDTDFYISDSSGSYKTPLYRYLNGNRHFYTTNYSRLGSGAGGWSLEGIAGYIWTTNSPYTPNFGQPVLLYRWIHTSTLTFRYTRSPSSPGTGWVLDNNPYSANDGYVKDITLFSAPGDTYNDE